MESKKKSSRLIHLSNSLLFLNIDEKNKVKNKKRLSVNSPFHFKEIENFVFSFYKLRVLVLWYPEIYVPYRLWFGRNIFFNKSFIDKNDILQKVYLYLKAQDIKFHVGLWIKTTCYLNFFEKLFWLCCLWFKVGGCSYFFIGLLQLWRFSGF